MKTIHIIGGGTFSDVAPHLSLAARAFGKTARYLGKVMWDVGAGSRGYRVTTSLTKMADPMGSDIVTNDDLRKHVDYIIADPDTKIVIFTCAPVDFSGAVFNTESGEFKSHGKHGARLRTDKGRQLMQLIPTEKIISQIRRERKDIFLVGFKTTAHYSSDEQYLAGLKLLKSASCNLVLANDVQTRLNMVITPEQARYYETTERNVALDGLAEMAILRARGTFTRTTVVPGEPVPWNDQMVPRALREVVDHCIARGAYKPFKGKTVGHFAVNLGEVRDGSGDRMFLTSRRKTNFNDLAKVGLVRVRTRGVDDVEAEGSKPSVGGQSQRIIFRDHPDADCIFHAHIPLKPGSKVPVRSQMANECGSHQCGQNTSDGLVKFPLLGTLKPDQYLYAVMLDKHGPNIVFPRSVDPNLVIQFIEENFDLKGRTDGVDPETAEEFEQGWLSI